ncbi:hypothetical protein BKI52_34925 [marine bacterium AO1-C]|nr:hypothetical protein BKI52_34925 [marine bacterium AO1-C]
MGWVSFLLAQTQPKFSKKQLRQDLKYLYKTLQKTHYNLYATTHKKAYNQAYRALRQSLKDSLTLLETYRVFQPFVALSKMGHCTTDHPFQRAYAPFLKSGGKVFPLNITIDKGKALVKTNYTQNDKITVGSELLAINGVPIKSTLDKIYTYLAGESQYLQNTILDMYAFPRVLWAVEEGTPQYKIKLKSPEGILEEFTVPAIAGQQFEAEYNKREVLFEQEREFKFLEKNIAYLRPGMFMNLESDGNTSKTETFEKGKFLKFIEQAFTQIKQQKAGKLIIDLRNNPGGSNTFSDEMLAYFAHKKFRFCSDFKVRTSEITKQYWRQVKSEAKLLVDLKEQILSHKNGQSFSFDMPYHQPRKDDLTFKGDVYVLINRYSYSQATITGAMVKDYGFGTLIGETTADVATNYGSIHQFSLPHTKIAISYPKALIVRPNGNQEFKGVEPDHLVYDNLFTKKDEILEFTLNLIGKSLIKAGEQTDDQMINLDK